MPETRQQKANCHDQSDIIAMLEDLRGQVQESQKSTMRKLLDIEESQSFLSRKYDEIIAKLDKIEQMETRLKTCEEDIVQKNKTINDLAMRLARSEQYSRKCMLELGNVACNKNENLTEVAIKVAEKVGVQLVASEIQAVHRLGKINEAKIPNVIIELTSRPKRDLWLAQRKKVVLNVDITGQEKGRIFLNEALSPFYKDLNYKVRNIIKNVNEKFFVWYRDYAICIRKDEENGKIIKIQSINDLQLLEKKLSQICNRKM